MTSGATAADVSAAGDVVTGPGYPLHFVNGLPQACAGCLVPEAGCAGAITPSTNLTKPVGGKPRFSRRGVNSASRWLRRRRYPPMLIKLSNNQAGARKEKATLRL